MKKASVLLVAIALAVFGLAACGSDDDDGGDDTAASETTEATETTETGSGGGGAASTLEVSAPESGDLVFDQSELSTAAGEVTVSFDNPAQIPHDVVIEDQSGNEVGKTDLVTDGSAQTAVDLEAGSYTFFCDVAGHRESGMEGTLTVN